jgi:hypothetical protein
MRISSHAVVESSLREIGNLITINTDLYACFLYEPLLLCNFITKWRG